MEEKTVLIAFKITVDRHEEIKEAAKKSGVSMAAFVRHIVYDVLNKRKVLS